MDNIIFNQNAQPYTGKGLIEKYNQTGPYPYMPNLPTMTNETLYYYISDVSINQYIDGLRNSNNALNITLIQNMTTFPQYQYTNCKTMLKQGFGIKNQPCYYDLVLGNLSTIEIQAGMFQNNQIDMVARIVNATDGVGLVDINIEMKGTWEVVLE